MSERQPLQDAIDRLPDAELLSAPRYLELLADLSPLDDEPNPGVDKAGDKFARQELARRKRITLDEMKREFGR